MSRTKRSLKNQIAAWTAAALWSSSVTELGSVRVGVVLVEDPRHVADVRDVRLVPGAQHVPVADVGVRVDVDAVKRERRPSVGWSAVDNAGKTLDFGRKIGGRSLRSDNRNSGVERTVGVGYVPADRGTRACATQRELGVGAPRRACNVWSRGRAWSEHRPGRDGLETNDGHRR